MIEIFSYILLGIFLISHAYWQFNLYKESKKIKTKIFKNSRHLMERLEEESNLPKFFFDRIKLSRKISKYALGIYLILFLIMLVKNYQN